jgi:NAD-dependent dihydropyrimidine dehydrogenase PreA subunit
MMSSVSPANTLQYDAERCVNCGLCSTVCPQGVFAEGDGAAEVVNAEACMECGACQLNCPAGAIQVASGVGCAYALMRAALTGTRESNCCGGGDSNCG